jgi:hypothetical protein
MPVSSEHSAAMDTTSPRVVERVMSLVFFVSGAAGLILEVVWFQEAAGRLAPIAASVDPDERVFWNWIGSHFGVGPRT